MEPTRSGERLSRRDHYEMPHQANHQNVPYERRYAAPPRVHDAWVTGSAFGKDAGLPG